MENKNKTSCPNLIQFNWVLRHLLCNKANFDVLKGFLTVLLGEYRTIRNIGESDGNRIYSEDIFNRVDFLSDEEKRDDDRYRERLSS
jgi:hypothetical protein